MGKERTKAESSREDKSARQAKHYLTSVVDTVDLTVLKLECADNIAGPGGDASNDNETDNARDHTQDVQRRRDGQNTHANLGLHHENDSSYEPDLVSESD